MLDTSGEQGSSSRSIGTSGKGKFYVSLSHYFHSESSTIVQLQHMASMIPKESIHAEE